MESKTNISKHSRHNSETTTLSTSKQKCVLNNSVHKRSKSNCFNSSSIVSTTTTNTNGCGNYNCNNKAHIKTVVFNSDALKSNEQIINVSYKVDPEKYKLMRGKNCLKIFINFLEEGNSNSNTKYNNVEVITTNEIIKSYQNMDNNYSKKRMNMNIDNIKSLNKSFKRSTSLYTKPVKITEDKKMDRKSIQKLNSELKKQNSIKKSPNRKKEPHMTGKSYGKDLLKKLSINNNNSNVQSQNNLLKNSISSFKRSKTNDDISNVINNNMNDNCENSIEMNTIEVKSKNGYNNIFNTGKKVGSYIRNKMLQKTAENKKRMKLNNSFRRYMNTNSSNNNKTVHKINNYNNKNNNNDSGIKYFSKTKKTLFPTNKYFSEINNNNNEREISQRIILTSNSNSPRNSFKKNTLYSNLLSDNLVIINAPEIILHKRLNLSHGEFRRKSVFEMQNSFNLNNNTIDNNGKHHLYYSINTHKSDNIKHNIPKGKSIIISTNTSTPITTIGINKDECSIENTKNSYHYDNSKGYDKVRHGIETKRCLNDTFNKEEIKTLEIENEKRNDIKDIQTIKNKNKESNDKKNMENVYTNQNGNVLEQQERKGNIDENGFIKGKSELFKTINNEERNVYCKYKEDNCKYGNVKENESQGVDDDRKSLNENTYIYNSSQQKEIPFTKNNAVKYNQEQSLNYHLDTSSKHLYKSTKQFYPISPQINPTTTELFPSSTNHPQTLLAKDYSKEVQSQINVNIPQLLSHSHRAQTQQLKTSPINPQESTNQMHLNLLTTQQQQSSPPLNHQYNSQPHSQTARPQQFQSQPDILKPSMISNTNQSIPIQTPNHNNINNDNNPSLNNNIYISPSSTQFNNPSLTKQFQTQPISMNQSTTNILNNNNTIINATTIPIDNEIPINKTNGITNNIYPKPKSNSTPHRYKISSQSSTIEKLRDISPLLVSNKKTQSIFNKKQKHLSFRLSNLSFLVKNKLAYHLSTNPSKDTTQQTQPQDIFYLRQKEIKSIHPPNAMIVDSVCFFK